MQTFFGFGLDLLPHAIEWLERAVTIERNFDAGLDQKRLWTLYQFVREFPELAVDSFAGKHEAAAGKRKRSH